MRIGQETQHPLGFAEDNSCVTAIPVSWSLYMVLMLDTWMDNGMKVIAKYTQLGHPDGEMTMTHFPCHSFQFGRELSLASVFSSHKTFLTCHRERLIRIPSQTPNAERELPMFLYSMIKPTVQVI